MKRVLFVLCIFMLAFTFAAAQAFAAGQQKDTKAGASGQFDQAEPREFGQQPGELGKSDQKAGAAGQQGRTGQMGTSQRSDQLASAKISRASELMDKKVQNEQGQDLGQVEDLVFSQDGQISYIIVSRGGVMGIGDKLTPIPFKNAQLSAQQDAVILTNIDKQKLENAPTITQGDWQMLTDPGFEKELFSYYGEQSGQGQMQPGMGSGSAGSPQESGAGQSQQRPGQRAR